MLLVLPPDTSHQHPNLDLLHGALLHLLLCTVLCMPLCSAALAWPSQSCDLLLCSSYSLHEAALAIKHAALFANQAS